MSGSGEDQTSPELRLLAPAADPVEIAEEATLRPRRLAEFVGQAQLKEHLSIMIEAARRREEPADHMLFAGPPGLGKTSLAGIVANEMGASFRVTSGPALVRAGDLAALLTNLSDGDVLFVDEIHRLARPVEEILYPAMEDFQLDIVLGKGPAARSLRLDLPRFTLVGATTRTGLITGPLRDRFGFVARLDYYEVADLEVIVRRSAGVLRAVLDRQGGAEIAKRSQGHTSPGQPVAETGTRLRRGPRRRDDQRGSGEVRPGAVPGRRTGPRQGGPGDPGGDLLPLPWRSRRPQHPCCCRRRGARDRRGRLRTVPVAARHAHADSPRQGGDTSGLGAPRASTRRQARLRPPGVQVDGHDGDGPSPTLWG